MLVANKVGLWGGVHISPGQARMGGCAIGSWTSFLVSISHLLDRFLLSPRA